MAKIGNLAARFLVALVAAPILLLAIYQQTALYTWLLVFIASILCMTEFFKMTLSDTVDRWVSLAFGVMAVWSFTWLGNDGIGVPGMIDGHLLLIITSVVGPLFYYLFRYGDISTVAARFGSSVSGIFYAGLMLNFLTLVRRDFGIDNHVVGGHLVVLVLMTAWLADTGGYFAGKAFGKRKLYEAISPNKSWAGAVGGTLCSIAGGVGFKVLGDLPLPWIDIIVLTGTGSIIGQLGDLAESMIKRSCDVKDSGSLLPGHGGILDRVDAVLLIAPYYYFYLTITARGL